MTAPDNLFVFILNYKSKADRLNRKQNTNSIVESSLVLSQLDMPDFVDPPIGNLTLSQEWMGGWEEGGEKQEKEKEG